MTRNPPSIRPSIRTFALLAALWLLAPWGPRDSGAAEPLPILEAPVVVELFTSQSCSSCPPADRLLGELADHADLIALSCHVTYWNHLDWRDTLSLAACTERQRAYAEALGSGVYTPQMVVNGANEFVGADRAQAVRAIARGRAALQAIHLELKDGALSARLPQLDAPGGPLTLWLAAFGPAHTQAMRSGENRGRTITYTNPVKLLADVGAWSGQAETRAIAAPPGLAEGKFAGLALLAQRGRTGAIRAAGTWQAPTR